MPTLPRETWLFEAWAHDTAVALAVRAATRHPATVPVSRVLIHGRMVEPRPHRRMLALSVKEPAA